MRPGHRQRTRTWSPPQRCPRTNTAAQGQETRSRSRTRGRSCSRLATDMTVDKKTYGECLPQAQARVHAAVRAARSAACQPCWSSRAGMLRQGRHDPPPHGCPRRARLPGNPIAAPTDEERRTTICGVSGGSRRAGRVTVFDRSWYGRVLSSASRALRPRPSGVARMPKSTTSRPSSSSTGWCSPSFGCT